VSIQKRSDRLRKGGEPGGPRNCTKRMKGRRACHGLPLRNIGRNMRERRSYLGGYRDVESMGGAGLSREWVT